MRGTVRGLIIGFALLMIGLLVIMGIFIFKGGRMENGNMGAKELGVHTVPIDDIDEISLSYESDDVLFYESDTDEIVIKEFSTYSKEERGLSKVTTSGNKLSVKGPKHRTRIGMFMYNYEYIEVYLPSSFQGKLDVATKSGEIISDYNFTLSSFQASSKSGDISAEDIEAENVEISTESGEIILGEVQGSRIIATSSGDISIEGGIGDSSITSLSGEILVWNYDGEMSASSSSGDITLKNGKGNTTIDTSSGEISLSYIDTAGRLQLSASSGDVSISIPRDTSLNFEGMSTSGDINTSFSDSLSFNNKGNLAEGTVGSNPTMDMTIQTTSGEIYVSEK